MAFVAAQDQVNRNMFDKQQQHWRKLLQGTDADALPGWQASLLRYLRIADAVLRDIASGLPTLRAMSLVYTTLLSLVPLLAVSFSVLKGFGVHNQVEPALLRLLAPLGSQGEEITARIIAFVDNIRVGVLGSLGLALLIYTVISLLKKIESAFNYTWHLRGYRSLAQRFTDYLSVIMVGPVLVFTAIGITASISSSSLLVLLGSIEPFGSLLTLLGKLLPYLLIIAAFTFIYKVVPNTQVQFRSALAGGLVAGVLWETVGWLFARFVAGATGYTAVYSGFAVLVVFMIWLYLSWMILLTGAAIAYYHQYPQQTLSQRQPWRLSARMREQLALLVMYHIADSFYSNGARPDRQSLAVQLQLPNEALDLVLEALLQAGLILRCGEQCNHYVPARSLEQISLAEIIDAARTAEENIRLNPALQKTPACVHAVLEELDADRNRALQHRTLLDLIQA